MLDPVDEPVVDLVGIHEQVVLASDSGDAVDVLLEEHATGRVVRKAEQDRARAWRDRALDRGRRETEVLALLGRDRHRCAAGEDDARHVRDVRGVGEDDLVAVVEGRAERKVDRLGHADGHEDLALRVVADAAQLRGVLADRITQRLDAVVRRVLRLALFDRADRGPAEALRRDEVRLAHAERDDALDAGDEIEEAADAARGQPRHTCVRQRAHRLHGATSDASVMPAFLSGRAWWCGVARSYAAATRNIVASANEFAMICSPTGRPSERPHGMLMPGRPAMLPGSVNTSLRYIASGSFTFCPILNATVGDVGVTIASHFANAASNSALMSVRTFCAFT